MIESYGGQQSEKIIRFFGHFRDGVSIWYMIYFTKFYRFLSSNVIISSFTAEFHSKKTGHGHWKIEHPGALLNIL